jgi:hypothetical protein
MKVGITAFTQYAACYGALPIDLPAVGALGRSLFTRGRKVMSANTGLVLLRSCGRSTRHVTRSSGSPREADRELTGELTEARGGKEGVARVSPTEAPSSFSSFNYSTSHLKALYRLLGQLFHDTAL